MYVLSVREVYFHGCLHYGWFFEKKSYAIWYFAFEEAQEINLQGNLQGSKYDGDFIFLRALFSFYEKVPSPLESIGFFQNIFTATISF